METLHGFCSALGDDSTPRADRHPAAFDLYQFRALHFVTS
jgi:hypothetical protein